MEVPEETKTAMNMTSDEVSAAFRAAVENRDRLPESEYVLTMDLNEKKPYKLYRDGRKEYLDV